MLQKHRAPARVRDLELPQPVLAPRLAVAARALHDQLRFVRHVVRAHDQLHVVQVVQVVLGCPRHKRLAARQQKRRVVQTCCRGRRAVAVVRWRRARVRGLVQLGFVAVRERVGVPLRRAEQLPVGLLGLVRALRAQQKVRVLLDRVLRQVHKRVAVHLRQMPVRQVDAALAGHVVDVGQDFVQVGDAAQVGARAQVGAKGARERVLHRRDRVVGWRRNRVVAALGPLRQVAHNVAVVWLRAPLRRHLGLEGVDHARVPDHAVQVAVQVAARALVRVRALAAAGEHEHVAQVHQLRRRGCKAQHSQVTRVQRRVAVDHDGAAGVVAVAALVQCPRVHKDLAGRECPGPVDHANQHHALRHRHVRLGREAPQHRSVVRVHEPVHERLHHHVKAAQLQLAHVQLGEVPREHARHRRGGLEPAAHALELLALQLEHH
eukprot:Unigene15253_Nuclearia_a/m.45622 Unigene15253_Nuclearia_a/g.45622  ORF Unigene15253_Nuclearia_a/g.45622 Unigene15253_Nuclearia_a/m.45622 type:complete len:434 (-) Unigene15253_Nuclearia_a:151-1452(-)